MNHKATTEQIRVENLHKQYGENEVLKGVSLTAHKGDVISIIGSSGSGKSTWLRCINFLEQPTSGRIVVAGEEVKLVPGARDAMKVADPKQLQKIRTRLSMVFQHFNLWAHMTVLQNVMFVPQKSNMTKEFSSMRRNSLRFSRPSRFSSSVDCPFVSQ